MVNPDPIIHIYRDVEFNYNTNDNKFDFSSLCECACGNKDNCQGLDAIRYDYCQSTNEEQCKLCTSLTLDLNKLEKNNNLLTVLKNGKTQYTSVKNNGLQGISEGIAVLTKKRALFEAQAEKIRALKQKIHVATEVLHTATGKLSHLSSSFNTLEQQNGLQYQDKVQVGIPYLPPFFTLSNRNYVIMMVCINVLLLIAIIVYAFMNRVRTDFDVVSTDSNKPAPTANAKTDVDSSSNKSASNNNTQPTETNRTRGGLLNIQDNHPNSLSGMNGHLYQ